ncbi:D-2-hydroxyacid dehydrogenase [Anoxynatronum sibiricum]|uniref:D-2-hydroxyacid dehydrogenase n=1 Tax=Anoxynatronum sibiricum TaxID=210623 RepID=A0ABU9VXI5_9CLOT
MRKLVVYAPKYLKVDREAFEKLLPADEWQLETVIRPEELAEIIEDAEVLVAFPCEMDILRKGRRLKWVQALSVGVDAFPLKELIDQGAVVTNGKGIHRIHMAEYAIAAMVMLARSIHLLMRRQFSGQWDRKSLQGEINGATLGILGLGTIGEEVAHKAQFMGMRVFGLKNNPREVPHVEKVVGMESIEWLFSESDYIVNLLPGTPATEHLVNRALLEKMKPEACLINMGRGSTIKETDLIEVLREGKIRAFWSDVFEAEPLPENSPLWHMENVVITPHICGESTKYMEKAMEIISHNLQVYLSGEGTMMNLVDPQKGY